jgi:putative holliday junction resolvase
VTRFIGLDHGRRRVGVAVADAETGLAFARPALRNPDPAAVLELVRAEGADGVILGLPRNMDGSEGGQAATVRRFGDRLVALGLSIHYQDERLSSWEAGRHLAAADRRPDRRSGELDSAAARLILQDYLDAHPAPRAQQETR